MKELNREIQMDVEKMDEMIEKLIEREEYHCTGNVCPADACGIHDIEY